MGGEPSPRQDRRTDREEPDRPGRGGSRGVGRRGRALAACGHDRRTAPPVPAGAGTLVIRVEQRESLIPPWELVRIPRFSLCGDGRMIVPGRREGALLVARERRLTDAQTARLYRRAYAAGLDRPRHLDTPNVLDGAQLLVTVATPDGPSTTTLTIPDAGGAEHGDRNDTEPKGHGPSGPKSVRCPARRACPLRGRRDRPIRTVNPGARSNVKAGTRTVHVECVHSAG